MIARLLLATTLITLAGCSTQPSAAEHAGAPMKIEVLGFADCPNTPEFLARVRAAARRVEGAQVVYVDQEALPASDLRRGYPTPTALVNGDDLFGLPRPTAPSMGCRMYEGGLPTADRIEQRLRAIAAK